MWMRQEYDVSEAARGPLIPTPLRTTTITIRRDEARTFLQFGR